MRLALTQFVKWTPVILVASCAMNAGPDPHTTSFITSAASTPFYKYGPAQAFGADENLNAGTHLTMLKRDFGYSRVMMDNGVSGFVPTEDVKPAPPPAAPKPAQKSIFNGWFGHRTAPKQPEPKLDLRDIPPPPLPTKSDTPGESGQDSPKFRVNPPPSGKPEKPESTATDSQDPRFRF